MRFAVNLAMLFAELPFPDRFAAAADAGFDAVEFWWPSDDDRQRVGKLAQAAGVDVIRFALDYGSNPRGLLCQPGEERRFRSAALTGLDFAEALGCTMVNAMVGTRDEARPLEEQLKCGRHNLEWLADAAAEKGITVLIEANCQAEKPGYLLDTSTRALAFVHSVARDNVALLFDAYHAHRAGEDVPAAFEAALPSVAHVQIADAPERREPGTGEMDYGQLLRAFHGVGYRGYVGLEYRPATTTWEGLSWLPRELRAGELNAAALSGLPA